jgi:molybdate transport system substrate-binding protein
VRDCYQSTTLSVNRYTTKVTRAHATIPIVLLATFAACRPAKLARPELNVAAAANLTSVFQELGRDYETQTGVHPVFSFASTAQLTRQIEESAPFDVFAAADAEQVDKLDREALLVAGSRAVYAVGILALWIPPHSNAAVTRIEDLTSPAVHVIAIANPELAPYGQAAVETLRHGGLRDQLKPKIVYAENINMAKQYGASNNADAVFTAYSLVLHEQGTIIQVDQRLHHALVQELCIIARSPRQPAARRFVQFLLGPGRAVLLKSGYK